MTLFATLLAKLIPLYINMAMGFIAGRWLEVDRKSIAAIVIYLIVPVVFFVTIAKMHIEPELLAIPLLTYMVSVCISMPTGMLAYAMFRDTRAGVAVQASGTGNNGYFGLPVALLLFDAQSVGIYMMAVIGITLFESSMGFYFVAQGRHTRRDSMLKLIRLPTLYAFAAGVLWSLMGWPLPGFVDDLMEYFKGAYTILGMMLIGIGLAGLKRLALDISFTALLFAAKFIAWPAVMLGLVTLDRLFLNWFGEDVHQALLLISIMPMAANTVAFAAIFDCEPEKIAAAVLLSTLFGAVYVPYMVTVLLP